MNEHRPHFPEESGRRVRSLRELPQELPPERDLWPQIEARLGRVRWAGWQVRLAAGVGLLALGAALTAGVWITHGRAAYDRLPADLGVVSQISPQIGPVDARARAALLRSLATRLQSLPPPSREKVLADLKVIEQSMQDIQTALGRDPGNALLREMLLETYQDEQHLIATVQEAGVWTQEAGSGKGSI
jgi:hypothetical protein